MKYRLTSASGDDNFYMNALIEHGFSVKKVNGEIQYHDRIYVTVSSLKALHKLCDVVNHEVVLNMFEDDVPSITIYDAYLE